MASVAVNSVQWCQMEEAAELLRRNQVQKASYCHIIMELIPLALLRTFPERIHNPYAHNEAKYLEPSPFIHRLQMSSSGLQSTQYACRARADAAFPQRAVNLDLYRC
jgi:hypothetical protein